MSVDSQQKGSRRALFEPTSFLAELQQTSSPLVLFKEQIARCHTILDQRFKQNEDIENIIQDLAWFTDQILISAWCQYDWADEEDISLLAVGGYGRGELHPHSDIDLQILLETDNKKKYQKNIEQFLTFLWDINLEIGQSVRTIQENNKEAALDITIATALMESRTIYGNSSLHHEVMSLVNKNKIWEPKSFFAAKVAEQLRRHVKHDGVEYILEPNIKVAPGGLRDIQTIGWITKRYFGADDFLELVERGFLQETEYNDLIKGRNFLWKLRYGLHMITKKREDRLLFEHQRTLAIEFGYHDDDKSLAIEKLMKEYYLIVQILRELNDVLLQIFDEEIIRSKETIKITAINSRFQIRNNYIEAINTNVFQLYPSALIEIFVLIAQNKKIEGIRAATIRLIRNSRSIINAEFRSDIRNNVLFMELLRSPYKMVERLRQMKRYGILAAYLPEFGKIIGQMQHDLFHIYTVDDHTLQVMEKMRRLHHSDAVETFPLAAKIIKRLPKIELLYIAGLYHDIAKGRGGDHSILGVKDADKFCRRHGLNKRDTNLVCWLVESHLTMSSIAQREDIQDPATIKKFALLVSSQARLDYLYVLTVTDINATNPDLWNSWRDSLLRQLYFATSSALSQGLERIVDKTELIIEHQNQAVELLKQHGLSQQEFLTLLEFPDEDYFLRESAEDIAWHTLAIKNTKIPMVLIKNNIEFKYECATQVFVYALTSRFLFANIATAFERLNMNVQDARIFNTQGNHCFITFMVLEANGKPVGRSKERNEEIKEVIFEFVSAKKPMNRRRNVRTSRKLRHFTNKTETTLSNNKELPYSILEVLSPDRPGLLSKIVNIFVDLDIILHNVKINTLGENIQDVFFITNPQNQPLHDAEKMKVLQKTIQKNLDAGVKQES